LQNLVEWYSATLFFILIPAIDLRSLPQSAYADSSLPEGAGEQYNTSYRKENDTATQQFLPAQWIFSPFPSYISENFLILPKKIEKMY
jgi:hypothetical protein